MSRNASKVSQFSPAAQAQARQEAEAAPAEVVPAKSRNPQKVFVLTPEQNRQLRAYCVDADTTIQAVVIEGINLVLKSKGLPELKQ
jgi:hypothetical protein